MSRRALATGLGSACLGLLAAACPAQAGRVVATGHPFDRACAQRPAPDPADGCGALRTVVSWSRLGAPDPRKPLLLLQPNDGPVQTALSNAYAGESPPSLQSVDPSASYAAQLPITPDAYSAVVVASDRADGTHAEVPAAVRTALRAFFDAGGGVVLLAGSPAELLPVGGQGGAGPRPYVRTTDGRDLGLTASDPDCCDLERTFREPGAGSALLVAERDGAGAAATVFGSGVREAAQLVSPIELPPGTEPSAADGSGADGGSCRSRRRFRLHVRRLPGLSYRRISISVANRPARVLTGGRIRSTVDLRGLPKGRYRVLITVTTSDGQTFTGARRYRTCSPKKLPAGRNRL